MVSFSNGSLSGEVSNKRPLENGYLPKYKPRKVSAIRDFPPRCGPNAVPINLKPEGNDGKESRIVEAIGVKNSEMTDAVVATGGISEMAVLIDSEAIGNSEMTNKTEADGVKAAKLPDHVKLHEIKNSEMKNIGSSSVKSSGIEADCQAKETVNSIVNMDMIGSSDALVEKGIVDANGVKNLVMETGPLGIQLPNEVEGHIHDAINNPIEVERAESLDAMVGKVTTTLIDGFSNDVDELITETEPIGVDKLNDESHMTADSSKGDTEVGGEIILKELNAADPPVRKELVLGSSQAFSSCTSTRPKDKYRRRRVSAVRDFPPNCGRKVSLLSEEEKQMVSSGHGLLDRIEKVELEQEATVSRNIPKVAIEEETSQKEGLDGLVDIHTRRETTEALNGGARSRQLGEEMEVTLEARVMDSEECNSGLQHSNIEKKEARQSVPQSRTAFEAGVDNSIDDTGGTVGKEIVVYSPGANSSSGNELHREVVHGLRAAPHCPWRKGKVAMKNSDGRIGALKVRKQNLSQVQKSKAISLGSNLKADSLGGPSLNTAFPDSNDPDGRPGSLTFTHEEDFGAYDECVPQITPISMFRSVDNRYNDFSESIGKDIALWSPGENNEMIPSNSTFNSADEVDGGVVRGLIAAPNCPWKRGNTDVSNSDGGVSGENKRKKISSWRKKAKAVARKSRPKAKFSGLPSKKRKEIHIANDADESPGALTLTDDEGNGHGGDFPTYSPASHKNKEFEVLLPPFRPNGSDHGNARDRVRDTLLRFHAVYRKILRNEEANTIPEEEGNPKQSGKKPKRIDLRAAEMIKEMGKEVNTGKRILGQVPGVEVGDEFQYRVELACVGIHRLYQAGIDWMKLNGVPVATSIVASGGYADDMENPELLIYSGQGGNVTKKGKAPEDQKLERGNLALKNSISAETPVRVVRGWKDTMVVDPLDPRPKKFTTYVYDGLYTVKRCWTEEGPRGKQIFKFELRRNPGQPELPWKELKKSSKSKFRPGVCVNDISGGQERLPICAVNTQDDEKAPPFTYTSKMINPDWYNPNPPVGCDCTGRCTDSRKCQCAVKNGGEIPYNRNGLIVEAKPVVYECGPHCRCPPSCYNRVTQRGIRFQLEIFKTESRGWGVRPFTSIPSGSFICEYAGELLEEKEAERRVGNDEYLFDIGQNYIDSSHTPEDQALSAELVEEGGYTIDAFLYGNIGRFINHSCSPNLYAQNVIYDHDDMKMPHVMFFAMDNIPPLQELTYHYNYSVDQIRDSDGNIKVKRCYCGSAECTGRMY